MIVPAFDTRSEQLSLSKSKFLSNYKSYNSRVESRHKLDALSMAWQERLMVGRGGRCCSRNYGCRGA